MILRVLQRKFVLNLLPLGLLIVFQALFKLSLYLVNQLLRDQLVLHSAGGSGGGLLLGDLVLLSAVLHFKVSKQLLLFVELVFETVLKGFGHGLTHLSGGCCCAAGRPLRLEGAKGCRVGCRA